MSVPSDLQRLTTITDSVFAVSVTLLAYSVRVPQALIGKPITLPELVPFLADVGALVLSFCIASLFWLSHRRDLQKFLNLFLAASVRLAFRMQANALARLEQPALARTKLPEASASIFSVCIFAIALGLAFVNPRWSEWFWALGFLNPLIESFVRRANRA